MDNSWFMSAAPLGKNIIIKFNHNINWDTELYCCHIFSAFPKMPCIMP